jgi:hypothetical protein
LSAARTLRLELSPSRFLAIVIVTLHAAAASCIAVAMPSLEGALLAFSLAGLGLASAWSRALLMSHGSVRAIELRDDGVVLETASGERIPAEVAQRRHVSRLTVTLPILKPRRRTLLVTGDMLTTDSFRLLRIWALWGKLPRVAEKQLPA